MCAECEREVEEARPGFEFMLEAERLCHKAFPDDSPQQHTIRLACTIVEAYHDTGRDIKTLALGFSIACQEVLALQMKSEMPPL